MKVSNYCRTDFKTQVDKTRLALIVWGHTPQKYIHRGYHSCPVEYMSFQSYRQGRGIGRRVLGVDGKVYESVREAKSHGCKEWSIPLHPGETWKTYKNECISNAGRIMRGKRPQPMRHRLVRIGGVRESTRTVMNHIFPRVVEWREVTQQHLELCSK